MRRTVVLVAALVALMSVSSFAGSDGKPLALVRLFPDVSFGDFQLHFGAAWYHDHRPTDREVNARFEPTDDVAAYVQVPLVSLADKAYLCFGGVMPLDYMDRSRPSFSLDTTPSLWCDGWPKWANVELGAYVMVSPYNAWGVQVGFLNLRF